MHDLSYLCIALDIDLWIWMAYYFCCRPIDRGAHFSQTAPANSLGLDKFSSGGTPDTASRKSVFTAFEESLKQPALSASTDAISPVSESTPRGSKKITLPKFTKKTHRRSSSEPAAVENWNLIKDQAQWYVRLLHFISSVTNLISNSPMLL